MKQNGKKKLKNNYHSKYAYHVSLASDDANLIFFAKNWKTLQKK